MEQEAGMELVEYPTAAADADAAAAAAAAAQCSQWSFSFYLRFMKKKISKIIFNCSSYNYLIIRDENVLFSLCPRSEKNEMVYEEKK